jgi:hypothetical protein
MPGTVGPQGGSDVGATIENGAGSAAIVLVRAVDACVPVFVTLKSRFTIVLAGVRPKSDPETAERVRFGELSAVAVSEETNAGGVRLSMADRTPGARGANLMASVHRAKGAAFRHPFVTTTNSAAFAPEIVGTKDPVVPPTFRNW